MARGTQGYSENASTLIDRYEAITFAEKHKSVLPFIPTEPSRILDVGAGTGGDANWLATQGHSVLAVEPTAEFRSYARSKYVSPRIEWIDDCLPYLSAVATRREMFGLILLSAVWMHLDEQERAVAMPVLASLVPNDGIVIMSLRHGPTPGGRVMFRVSPEETVSLARHSGLVVLFNLRSESVQSKNREAGVTWSHIVLRKYSE